MPLGQAISMTKRPDAPLQVLLVIHMDTVYGPDHPFAATTLLDDNRLQGPGVADAKGGLVVMLTALEAFEQFPQANNLGWQVIINPDEELGSPGSAALLAETAQHHHVGLVFEPTLPDGTLIAARKGSGNFSIAIHGRSAHAGRDIDAGRNAIHAMAKLIDQLTALPQQREGLTVSAAYIEGGTAAGPANIVPDLAVCRLNMRVANHADQAFAETELQRLVNEVNSQDGYSAQLHGCFQAPPKPLDEPLQQLLDAVAACGRELDIPIRWRDSGGVCDGNKLAAAGLVNVDTLGPRGGDIHSENEYLLLDSLTERAKLTALLLMKLAAGDITPPRRKPRITTTQPSHEKVV